MDVAVPRAGGFGDELPQAPGQVRAPGELARPRLRLQALHYAGGRGHTDIRVDQRLLQPLERLVVERSGDARLELRAERPASLRQVVAQAPEQPLPRVLRLRGGRGGRVAPGHD